MTENNSLYPNKNNNAPNTEPVGNSEKTDESEAVQQQNTNQQMPPFYVSQPYYPQNGYCSPCYNQQKVKKEWPLFKLSAADTVFACILSVMCIAGVSLALWSSFDLGFTVSCAAFIVAISIYLKQKYVRPGAYAGVCCVLALLCTTVFSVGSNSNVRFFTMAAGVMLTLVWFNALGGNKAKKGDLGLLNDIFCSLFGNALGGFVTSYKSLFAGESKRKKSLLKVLIGIACAVPVLFIIVPLLIKSDAAFEGMVNSFLEDMFTWVMQVIVGLAIALFFVPYCISLKHSGERKEKASVFSGIDNVVITAFLSVISVCYAVYLFSQLAYFFSAFSGFLPNGYSFSYSEYARRGFFEMCIISGINLAITFAALLLSKKNNGKMSVALRALCTYINAFTLVIIVTSVSKMVMYIGEYGMTVSRILSSSFMIFLAVVVVAMILRCYFSGVNVLRTALVTGASVLIVLGLFNVNHIVADYNYNAFMNGQLETLDVETIYNLGDEGVPYIVKLVENRNLFSSEVILSHKSEKEAKDGIKAIDNYLIYEFNDYYNVVATEGQNSTISTHSLESRRLSELKCWRYSRSIAYEYLESFFENNPGYYDNNCSEFDAYGFEITDF